MFLLANLEGLLNKTSSKSGNLKKLLLKQLKSLGTVIVMKKIQGFFFLLELQLILVLLDALRDLTRNCVLMKIRMNAILTLLIITVVVGIVLITHVIMMEKCIMTDC